MSDVLSILSSVNAEFMTPSWFFSSCDETLGRPRDSSAEGRRRLLNESFLQGSPVSTTTVVGIDVGIGVGTEREMFAVLGQGRNTGLGDLVRLGKKGFPARDAELFANEENFRTASIITRRCSVSAGAGGCS